MIIFMKVVFEMSYPNAKQDTMDQIVMLHALTLLMARNVKDYVNVIPTVVNTP